MNRFPAWLTILTVMAIALGPAWAAVLPCCCAQEMPANIAAPAAVALDRGPVVVAADPHAPCCPSHGVAWSSAETPVATLSVLPACCVERQMPRDEQLRGGCCCVQAAPEASPARDRDVRATIEFPPSIDVAAPVAILAASFKPLPAFDERRIPRPSGPPLLALLCTWLN